MSEFFLTHSPYQIAFAQDLIESSGLNSRNTILIVEGKRFSECIDLQAWGKVLFVEETHGKKFSITGKKITEEVAGIIENNSFGDNVLYVSDLIWPLNNEIAHNFAREFGEVNLMEDGVGSYLSGQVGLADFFKFSIRFLAGKTRIFNEFTPFAGRFIGQDSKVISCLYVYNKMLLDCSVKGSKVKEVKRKACNEKFLGREGCALIIGQPSGVIFKNKYIDLAKKEMSRLSKARGEKKIYYKPHPRISDTFDLDIDAELLEREPSVESLIKELDVSVVISFLSTALINIKATYPKITCVAIIPIDKSFYRKRNLSQEVEHLLNKSNVELCSF